MSLTKLALKRPVSIAMIILALVVFGISSVPGFQLELTPDIELPMLLVYTIYPGADPESVEELVTKQVEAAGSEQNGVSTYTSQSAENMSMVMFQYDYGTDLDDAYMDLRTALDTATAAMPDDAQDPIVIEMAMDQMETMDISVTAVGDSDVLSYVNDTMVPELETISGVADVSVRGGRENYIRVLLDSRAMKEYGVTMSGIAQTVAAMDFTVPVGSVSQGTQDIAVSSSADIASVVQIQNIPITTARGQVIPLSEVSQVSESQRDADSISRYNGQENVSLAITKKKSYGTVDVTRDVDAAIERLQADNDVVVIETIYNASDMIISSLSSVGSTLALGVVLSMLVLFLFFGDIRASLIVGSAMPISLFATMIGMNLLGFSFNVVTMGALVIAIGMMVDSSIVVLESCFRLKDETGEYRDAALKGTGVVTASIIASTITTVVVYAPLSLMDGLAGQLFSQLGMTIIMAMLASLIMAMTIIPLLFAKFKPVEKKELPINKLLRKINVGYDKLLRKLLPKKGLVLIISVLLLVAAFMLVSHIHTELMPSMDEHAFSITASFRSGTKMEQIEEQTAFLEEMAEADANIDHYSYSVSGDTATLTAYLADDCELSTGEAIEQYTKKLSGLTNMDISISASGASITSMMGGGIEIDLVGRDLDDLRTAAKQVQDALKEIPGILQTASDLSDASTQAKIIIDPLKSMAAGLAPVQVAGEMYNTMSGIEAVKLKKSGQELSVRLEYPDEDYSGMNELMNMTLTTPYGTQIPLSEIAAVEYQDSPVTLTRVDGIYQVAVTASTTEDARFTAQEAADEVVDQMVFPKGVSRASSMMDDMILDEFQAIIVAIFVAVFLIFLVMAMQFESPRFSMMVMLSIPFALIGSFGLLYVTGTTLSMVSLMGVLMLVGIVVNNGILYVDTVNQLREEISLEEALIQSGQIRLRPILMTTLTTILSMVPMSLGIGDGSVMMEGMAMVIIGGLIASTILILLLLPTFYLIIDKRSHKEKRLMKKEMKNRAKEK
ncbi:MAG: efflux RND transporter permease subunit [Bacteroidales bacterium]|nr:efflux RND transporter permease subunit [Bacteroidales bacterium]MCM1416528.1 efflux RND transporter permease subunit [bacterium]MCM1424535.1 efflux RND transporter permease subunit [bacterium]